MVHMDGDDRLCPSRALISIPDQTVSQPSGHFEPHSTVIPTLAGNVEDCRRRTETTCGIAQPEGVWCAGQEEAGPTRGRPPEDELENAEAKRARRTEGDNVEIDAMDVSGRQSPDYSSAYYATMAVTTAPNWRDEPIRAEEEDDGLWVPGSDGMYRFDDDDFDDWESEYTAHTSAEAFWASVTADRVTGGVHSFPIDHSARCIHMTLVVAGLAFVDVCYDRTAEQIVVRFPRGGLTRKMRNRMMHALNGNGKGKPIPCVLCATPFVPAVPGHKRCSACISGLFSAAGVPAAGAPAGAAAGGPPGPAGAAAAAAPAPVVAQVQFGPSAAGVQAAARAAPPPPKGLWDTIMEQCNELRQMVPAGFKESTPGGLVRNDVATEHLCIGGATIQGIGYVVTFDHAAISEDYVDYSYNRQRNLKEVAINGVLHGSQDWLYSVGRVGQVSGIRLIATPTKTVQASENGRLINVEVFRLSVTTLDVSAERRYVKFVARDAIGRHITYSSYRGANVTGIVCGGDEVVQVATNLFMECERYFITPETSRIAESTIRGTMKNNTALGGDEMEALIKYHSAKHQGRVVARNAAIGAVRGFGRGPRTL